MVNKYGLVAVLILSVLTFLNGCGSNVRSSKLSKQLDVTNARIDSLGAEIRLLKEKTVSSDQIVNIVKGVSPQAKPVNITIKK